jgi:hypothetical protein
VDINLGGSIMREVSAGIAAIVMTLLGANYAGAAESPVARAAPGAAPERLGTVHFATSCDPAVQVEFDRAMALLHSFWVKDSIEGFTAVQQRDPGCAIALWGIAMSLQQNPLIAQEPNGKTTQDALAALDKAKAIGAKTARERDYIAAIDLIYRDADKTDFRNRRLAYEKAMEELAQRYPDDAEAQIFYALAVDMTAPLTDKTYANQLKAAAILEKVLQQQPEHPGVAHYLIHSYDYPPIAERGLPAARHYIELAPNHPHAQHMPSHIFTRLGMWPDSVNSNLRSAAAAKAEGNGQEQAHAMDYLVHAYLQLGQDAAAKRVVDESATVAVNPAVFVGPYALAAMPARYALERRAWSEAIQLQAHAGKFPFTEAITHFARGLGFARTGDLPSAQTEETTLAQARDALAAQNNTYWSNQVEVQRLAVAAWSALAQGRREDALTAMRASSDLEDTMEKHIVTPSPVVPARELLGEMLLEVKQPAEALAAFEASAKREPSRLRGLYGAARAAAAAGDRGKAAFYYTKLVALAQAADAPRPEWSEAKAYLAQR